VEFEEGWCLAAFGKIELVEEKEGWAPVAMNGKFVDATTENKRQL
jgi:hypothetical protein